LFNINYTPSKNFLKNKQSRTEILGKRIGALADDVIAMGCDLHTQLGIDRHVRLVLEEKGGLSVWQN
jgi:hypothetical protein